MAKYVIAIVLLLQLGNAVAQTTSPLKITPMVGDFYIYTTYRSYQGKPFPANGMYLITNKGAVLIDTPWDTTQLQPLLDSIRIKHNKKVRMAIATHSHADRTAGFDYYRKKGIRTYTTRQTDEISKARKEKRASYLIEKDSIFSVGQYSFQTFYPGEGHTQDNIVIWFPQNKILYGGCLVKSTEAPDLGNLADANTKEYGNTIKKIQRTFSEPAYIIPGHQDWTSKGALNHTLRLVDQYEKTTVRESPFELALEDISLHGTLTLPAHATSAVPVVLLIPGSGQTDRNGNNFTVGLNCDSYKQLAHALATHNIASLRYDKRGVGESKPLGSSVKPRIFETEVIDARMLADSLNKNMQFSQVIIAGHSQGALVGMLVSSKAKKFISLNGVALNGAETIRLQLAAQPPMIVQKANLILDSLKAGYSVTDVPKYLDPLFKPANQPYLISWFRYEPAIELRKLSIPSLIIQGDNDIQIRTEDARKFAAGLPGAELLIIPGMNHLFKIVSETRVENLRSYGDPSLKIAPLMVEKIVNFVAGEQRNNSTE